jgi:uncharacterized protein (PEP-CTERM system associated)
MAIMAMDMAKINKFTAIGIALVFTNIASAGDWEFDPSIKIDETYTDNVTLNTSNKKSSLVSQAGINIDSSYEAQNAVFNFSSQSTYALYSHDHELDNDYHDLKSDFRVQLWPNGLIVLGSASITNESRNDSRNALADIVSADTIQVSTYNSGLEYRINNSDFIILSAIGLGQTNSEDNIGNRDVLATKITSTNGTNARHVFWELDYNYQELNNENQKGELSKSEAKLGWITPYKINPFIRYYKEDNIGNFSTQNRSLETNSVGLGARWVVSTRLYLDISYNKPTDSKLDIEGDEQKEYIDASIKWQPSVRTTLTANISERFYGDSYGLNFVHQNKRLTNSISYAEDLQTLTRNNYVSSIVGYYFCPNNTVTSTEECIIQDNSTISPSNPTDPNNPSYQIFPIRNFTLVEDDVLSLNKTLSWSSVLALPRTTFSLKANKQNRENLDTRLEDDRASASLNISRTVSARSNIGLNISYTETSFQTNTEFERKDRYRQFKINYDKSLNSALSFDLVISYLNRSSNDSTLNYKEGRISATITKGF